MQERGVQVENNNELEASIDRLNQEGVVVLEKNDPALGSLISTFVEKFKPIGKRMVLPVSAVLIAISAACSNPEDNKDIFYNNLDLPQKIAFVSDRDGNPEIYTMNPDGTDQQNLTNNSQDDFYSFNPWSPDGSHLVYMVDENGNLDIFLIDREGKNRRQLTDHPEDDIWPLWSPDGSKIGFVSDRDGNNEIYVMNADGTDLKNITNNPADEGVLGFTWSPDGTKIAYSSTRNLSRQLFVIDINGENETLIADTGSSSDHLLESYWSPDGTKIAFAILRTLVGNDVYVVNLDDKKFTRLNEFGRDGVNVRWSPDSKNLLFEYQHFSGCGKDIYSIEPDGSNPVNLTNSDDCNSFGTWSFDGDKIAFSSDRDGNDEIYSINSDGSNVTRLTNNSASDSLPSFSPVKKPSRAD